MENPPIPAGPWRQSKVTPIRHRELAHYPDILKAAFEKYPISVIQNYMNIIQFAGEIKAGALDYGGTYDCFRRIIYLVDNGTNDVNHAVRTFHHEFSSLLLARHSFFINPWTDHNPEGFEYIGDLYDDYATMKKNVKLLRIIMNMAW